MINLDSRLIIMLFIFAQACGIQENSIHERSSGDEHYSVNLALIGFYDKKVTIKIDGKEILNETINVSKLNEITGLNQVKEIEVSSNPEIELNSENIRVWTQIKLLIY